MYEVELKVRAEHGAVRDRLSEAGAEHVGDLRQEDTYFDAPDRDFAETDEALRIREQRGSDGETTTYLTYKGPLVDEQSKTREEAETPVEDGDALRGILSGLGYRAAATVRKERSRYELDGCTVTLDDVEGIGEFVEVEIETDREIGTGGGEAERRLSELREEAAAVLDRLGLDPEDGIRTSYLGLLLDVEEP